MDENSLIEFSVSLPFSITINPERDLNPVATFLLTLHEAVYSRQWTEDSRQNWYFADSLYLYLTTHSELLDLISKFPNEVSLDELLSKVEELTNRYVSGEGLIQQIMQWGADDFVDLDDLEEMILRQPWSFCTEGPGFRTFCDPVTQRLLDYVIPGLKKFYHENLGNLSGESIHQQVVDEILRLITESGALEDPELTTIGGRIAGEFTQTQSDLYLLATWDSEAEGAAIDLLNMLLLGPNCIPDTIRIGENDVEVPFKSDFIDFLVVMQQRQTDLESLKTKYFGEKELPSWLKAWNKGVELAGLYAVEQLRGGQEMVEDVVEWAWEGWKSYFLTDEAAQNVEGAVAIFTGLQRQQLANTLSALSGVAQVGTNFQTALVNDPKNTLAGLTLGMAGAGTAAFLFLDIYFYVTDPSLGWGGWRYDTGNPEFQAGMTMGEFSVGFAQTVVGGIKLASPGATPGVGGITIDVGSGLQLVPGEAAALQYSAGFTATVSAAVAEELAALGVDALAGYGTWMAMSGGVSEDDDNVVDDGSPGSPSHKAAAWEKYQNNPDNAGWSYERWGSAYDQNMLNPRRGQAAVEEYIAENGLDWGSTEYTRVATTEDLGYRVFDYVDTEGQVGIEFKSVDRYSTGSKRFLVEFEKDAYLVAYEDWEIIWIFEANEVYWPVINKLKDAGIVVIVNGVQY